MINILVCSLAWSDIVVTQLNKAFIAMSPANTLPTLIWALDDITGVSVTRGYIWHSFLGSSQNRAALLASLTTLRRHSRPRCRMLYCCGSVDPGRTFEPRDCTQGTSAWLCLPPVVRVMQTSASQTVNGSGCCCAAAHRVKHVARRRDLRWKLKVLKKTMCTRTKVQMMNYGKKKKRRGATERHKRHLTKLNSAWPFIFLAWLRIFSIVSQALQ